MAEEINTCLKLLINLHIEIPLLAALFEEPENAQIMIKWQCKMWYIACNPPIFLIQLMSLQHSEVKFFKRD